MKTNYKEQIDPELRDNIRNFPFNMALVKIGRAYQEAAYRKTEVPDGIVQKTIEITGTQGHIMLEINATRDRFCISFQTLIRGESYFKEFLKVLDEEGIPYEYGEKEDSKLPFIQMG